MRADEEAHGQLQEQHRLNDYPIMRINRTRPSCELKAILSTLPQGRGCWSTPCLGLHLTAWAWAVGPWLRGVSRRVDGADPAVRSAPSSVEEVAEGMTGKEQELIEGSKKGLHAQACRTRTEN